MNAVYYKNKLKHQNVTSGPNGHISRQTRWQAWLWLSITGIQNSNHCTHHLYLQSQTAFYSHGVFLILWFKKKKRLLSVTNRNAEFTVTRHLLSNSHTYFIHRHKPQVEIPAGSANSNKTGTHKQIKICVPRWSRIRGKENRIWTVRLTESKRRKCYRALQTG